MDALKSASLVVRASDRLAKSWMGVQRLYEEEFPMRKAELYISMKRPHLLLSSIERIGEWMASRFYEFCIDEYHRSMIISRVEAIPVLERIGKVQKAEGLAVNYGNYGLWNPVAQAAHQRNRMQLIQQVTESQRRTFNSVIDRQVFWGQNPRVAATELKNSLGLTEWQNRTVANYRRELETGSVRALRRKLRDARHDPTVLRNVNGERPLPQEKVDQITERYRQRWILHRARTIARTEALRAVNGGQDGMWRSLVDEGKVQPGAVKRFWVVTRDGRQRDSHDRMPELNELGRAIGEPFESGHGNYLMHPGDPSAPPEETVNCRCVLTYSQDSPSRLDISGKLPMPMEGMPYDAKRALGGVLNRHIPRKMPPTGGPSRKRIILEESGIEALFGLGALAEGRNQARVLARRANLDVLDDLIALEGVSVATGVPIDELLPGTYDQDGRYSPRSL